MKLPRRFPAPWQIELTASGFKVLDATGQALAYIYARETQQQADIAKVLTFDEARRIAVNVARLAELLEGKQTSAHLEHRLLAKVTAQVCLV